MTPNRVQIVLLCALFFGAFSSCAGSESAHPESDADSDSDSDGDSDADKKRKEEQLPLFTEILALYRQQEWNAAIEHLDKALQIFPDDIVSHYYMERCNKFKKTPPPNNWDGSVNIEKSANIEKSL